MSIIVSITPFHFQGWNGKEMSESCKILHYFGKENEFIISYSFTHIFKTEIGYFAVFEIGISSFCYSSSDEVAAKIA